MSKYDFSLLWPSEDKGVFNKLPPRTIEDLNIDSIIDNITKNRKTSAAFREYLTSLPQDINVIKHRQDSFEDIMENNLLREVLTNMQPYLSSLLYFNGRVKKEKSPLFEMIFRINELKKLIHCVESLNNMFNILSRPLRSNGFKKLNKWVNEFISCEDYMNLKNKLPGIIKSMGKIKSISLGINLDSALMPTGITIEKVNTFSFNDKRESFITSLFSKDSTIGLTELDSRENSEDFNEILNPQMRKLSKYISKASGNIIFKIKKFRQTNSNALINLKSELDFLLEASKLFKLLKNRGIEVSRPQVYSSQERFMKIKGARNLNLVLTRVSDVIPSNINFTPKETFTLISGPNSGGKTVYLQSIGLNQILAQTGLYVLGTDSKVSIVDNIYTHYQIEEIPGDGQGRFGIEIKRLKEILPKITSSSLLLLNETFSSTNVDEAIYIAEDILRYICEIGSRGGFTTHMHTLVDKIPTINKKISSASKLFPMVSKLGSDKNVTYEIVKGSNESYTYALNMARKMDICFDKLMESNIIKCGQER